MSCRGYENIDTVKFALEQATNAYSTLSLTLAVDGGWVGNATPRPLYARYLL